MLMIAVFLSTLLSFPVLAADTVMVTCELSSNNAEIITVECPGRTYDIPADEWATIRGLGTVVPKVGMRLEMEWPAGADCGARTAWAVDKYCGGMYCTPPINSLTPEDCLNAWSP